MNRPWRQLGVVLIIACQGCVTLRAPLEADGDYLQRWGAILPLGPECKSIVGTYSNEGVGMGADGACAPLLLTSVFKLRTEACTASFAVRTRKLDQNGDAFVSLLIILDGDPRRMHEFESCFCVRETLVCAPLEESYWSFPNFGFGGKQENVYLAIANDSSLIARLQNYHADVILGLPIFRMKEPWARFGRAMQ
jgi:hypothetical protein